MNIDTLDIAHSSDGTRWWLMDDFTYEGTPVPEPATMLLIPENLDHYRPEDYEIAERKFLRHVLFDRIVRYQEETYH